VTRRELSRFDQALVQLDHALRTIAGEPRATRPSPAGATGNEVTLDAEQRAASARLMRVNHAGEIAAQALYMGQAMVARDPETGAALRRAAAEEGDHLAWCEQRLGQLGARVSVFTPLWYVGSFAIGSLAGIMGDRWSLGFVVETERQVERHLAGHLDRLPDADLASRRILEQMQADEVRHADAARAAGGRELPRPIQSLMRAAAKVMTSTAYRF